MNCVNRAALIIRPREPYLAWVASLDADAPTAAEALRGTSTVYLVTDAGDGTESGPALVEVFEEIFERELESWWSDHARWPKPLDLATFERWFEVSGQSLVFDMGRGRIVTERI